ncbi:MAG: hypothetical protein Q4A65_04645 [Bacillota bacterium]|nr:hypothetical protein [Bacillota bacterium]
MKNSELMTRDDFVSLCDEAEKQVDRICNEIYEGRIEIAPKREKKRDMDGARRNTRALFVYRSICMY